ncbi:DnaJ-domain-containing protein [Exidia glandulosa HHB12029]|uniref:DnaJ-domain-containing protein n=1 Tax=Exidia glandulosa HHB12029 TaxID=1314781 RepID=A0A165B4V9_EXIGL|nr:DnaJ-domain-containing protein [Exidia glandulosa HHB12029]
MADAPRQTVTITVEERRAAVARIRRLPADADFYEILQVQEDCGHAEIKKAYRNLVLLVHPDKATVAGVKGADEAFKVVAEAYETLSDPSERAAYDSGRRASAGFANWSYTGAGSGSGSGSPTSPQGQSRQQQPPRGKETRKQRRRREYRERLSKQDQRQRDAREARAREEAEEILHQYFEEALRRAYQQHMEEHGHEYEHEDDHDRDEWNAQARAQCRRRTPAQPLWKDLLWMAIIVVGAGTILYFGWKILRWVLGPTTTNALLGIAAWIAFQVYGTALWANRVYRATLVIVALGVGYGALMYLLIPLAKGGLYMLRGASGMLLGVASSSVRYSYRAASSSVGLAYTGATYTFTTTPGRVVLGGATTLALHAMPAELRTDVLKLTALVPACYGAYHALVALCSAAYALVSTPAVAHVLFGGLAAGVVLYALHRRPVAAGTS